MSVVSVNPFVLFCFVIQRFLSQIHRNIHVFLLFPLNMSDSSYANNAAHGSNVNMDIQFNALHCTWNLVI